MNSVISSGILRDSNRIPHIRTDCLMCQDTIEDGRFLSCGHAFCAECIEQRWDEHKQIASMYARQNPRPAVSLTAYAHYAAPHGVQSLARCPVCLAGFSLEETPLQGLKVCRALQKSVLVSVPASFYAQGKGAANGGRMETRSMRKNRVVLEDKNIETLGCAEHGGLPYEYYCDSCIYRPFLCRECAKSDLKENPMHHHELYEKGRDDLVRSAKALVKGANTSLQAAKDKSVLFEDATEAVYIEGDQCMSTVNNSFDAFTQQLNEYEKDAIQQVRKFCHQDVKQLSVFENQVQAAQFSFTAMTYTIRGLYQTAQQLAKANPPPTSATSTTTRSITTGAEAAETKSKSRSRSKVKGAQPEPAGLSLPACRGAYASLFRKHFPIARLGQIHRMLSLPYEEMCGLDMDFGAYITPLHSQLRSSLTVYLHGCRDSSAVPRLSQHMHAWASAELARRLSALCLDDAPPSASEGVIAVSFSRAHEFACPLAPNTVCLDATIHPLTGRIHLVTRDSIGRDGSTIVIAVVNDPQTSPSTTATTTTTTTTTQTQTAVPVPAPTRSRKQKPLQKRSANATKENEPAQQDNPNVENIDTRIAWSELHPHKVVETHTVHSRLAFTTTGMAALAAVIDTASARIHILGPDMQSVASVDVPIAFSELTAPNAHASLPCVLDDTDGVPAIYTFAAFVDAPKQQVPDAEAMAIETGSAMKGKRKTKGKGKEKEKEKEKAQAAMVEANEMQMQLCRMDLEGRCVWKTRGPCRSGCGCGVGDIALVHPSGSVLVAHCPLRRLLHVHCTRTGAHLGDLQFPEPLQSHSYSPRIAVSPSHPALLALTDPDSHTIRLYTLPTRSLHPASASALRRLSATPAPFSASLSPMATFPLPHSPNASIPAFSPNADHLYALSLDDTRVSVFSRN